MINWCEQQKDRQLDLLKELAAIPAPSHHEDQRAEFIKNWFVQRKDSSKHENIRAKIHHLGHERFDLFGFFRYWTNSWSIQ